MYCLKNSFAQEETFITLDEAPLSVQKKTEQNFPDSIKAFTPLLQKADIISFDVFDTLLIRPLANPHDIFMLIEKRLGIKGFCAARIKAETKAREKFYAHTGSTEITLEHIYQELILPPTTPHTPSDIMQVEIKTEHSLLTRSPLAGALYDLAISLGKTVIAVSDMYLPAPIIAECLAYNNMPVSRVFVSCAYQASKHEGKLHNLVAQALHVEPARILHFGDNFKADCSAALEAGTTGYFLPSLYQQLCHDTRYNQQAVSALTRHNTHHKQGAPATLFTSALLAYIARFKAAHPLASMGQIFGAMYAGPLVSGFAIWLNNVAQADSVTHLRLVTRDGYITKKVWDTLGFSGQASILQSSRRLTLMPALCTVFEQEIENLISIGENNTLRRCISKLDLGPAEESLLKELSQFADIDSAITTRASQKAALDALKNCKTSLQKIAAQEKAAYTAYLTAEGFDPHHDAMVDCGWSLSSHRRTEEICGQTFKGYYIGSLKHAHMHAKIRSFLFHKGSNPLWNTIAERGIELLELPFASLEAQVSRFEITPAGVTPVCVSSNPQYSHVSSLFIEDMQKEILNFAEFIKPFQDTLELADIEQSLLILFNALVNAPTPYEYNGLATLPHGRELGACDFSTIGTFWHGGALHAPPSPLLATTWRSYAYLSWVSLKEEGIRSTWAKAKRVLRRKTAQYLPAFHTMSVK